MCTHCDYNEWLALPPESVPNVKQSHVLCLVCCTHTHLSSPCASRVGVSVGNSTASLLHAMRAASKSASLHTYTHTHTHALSDVRKSALTSSSHTVVSQEHAMGTGQMLYWHIACRVVASVCLSYHHLISVCLSYLSCQRVPLLHAG